MAAQIENTGSQPKAAASPSASTASAPSANRPSLCIKPMPSSTSPPPSASVISPPVSLTSKEWIIPPRPKPGRKPATDTPPTKRKAQNRAAQRAFRERRAARVGELEEQIRQIEDDNDRQIDNLHATIADLEKSLEKYQADLATWMGKYKKLEGELVEVQAQLRQRKGDVPKGKSGEKSLIDSTRHPAEEEHQYGCGNCTIDSHCQCIDDVVQAMNGDIDAAQLEKRSSPSSASNPNKRVKVESRESDEMEIDFTSAFAKTSNVSRGLVVSPRSNVADPCGFCQDGTPCICAEMAAEQERRGNTTRPTSPVASNHPTARQLAQFTPPPSDGDAGSGIVALGKGGCGSRPGTCQQCRADPNSTLFCKSLAASRRQASNAPDGCCGSRGTDGGCCQTSSPLPSRSTRSRTAAATSVVQLPLPHSKSSVTLSCADAYMALSRHTGYERASGEMASWMPKLHATSANTDGRPAMEIDAANVMAVLKDFDRRFGANK